MATTQPELVLYDLACNQGVCFSPTVWKIRLMLNYKGIPYKTIFLEFPDIEPTLSKLGIQLPSVKSAGGAQPKYTVPAIHHFATDTKMMDSVPIAHFLEENYPAPKYPAVVLESALGQEIELAARSTSSPLRTSILPREIHILNPPSQIYFRKTREALMGEGKKLESLLLSPEDEDAAWASIDPNMQEVSALMRTNKASGPFILGAQPSLSDFFVAGAIRTSRCVDEGIFQRFVKYEGHRAIYEGCEMWMVRED